MSASSTSPDGPEAVGAEDGPVIELTSSSQPMAQTPVSPDHPAPLTEPARLRTRSTAQSERSTRSNVEMYTWLFMRLSGIALVVLVLGHLLIQLVLDGGVSRIGFAFVAGRWASPFWQVWDLLLLWLAMLHGTAGLRTIINDYAERDNHRFWLRMLLYTATVIMVSLGTLVIFTFDPNIR